MVEDADPFLANSDVIASAADVEHAARLDAEQLARLLLVGVEADVLANGELLLADVGDRRACGRLADRERRHPVEVRDRPDQLVDEEPVGVEPIGHRPRL